MSTLGYGMYGFNTLNVNGETSDLPACRLLNTFGGSYGNAANFQEASDVYGMVIPNQGANGGSYSAIRTPISGLYEIDYRLSILGGGGAGVSEADIYVDNSSVFNNSNGIFSYNASPGAFIISQDRQSVPASTTITFGQKILIFLEKDRYITVAGNTISGTAATYGGNVSDYFSVRCISAENSVKYSWQY